MTKLNTTILIKGADQSQIFTPEDELPEWAIEQLEKDGTKGVFAEENPEPNINDAAGRPLDDNELATITEERDGLAEQVRGLKAQLADLGDPDERVTELTAENEGLRTRVQELEAAAAETETAGAQDEAVDYDKLHVPELQALATKRNIETDGLKKPQLVAALKAADEAKDQ